MIKVFIKLSARYGAEQETTNWDSGWHFAWPLEMYKHREMRYNKI